MKKPTQSTVLNLSFWGAVLLFSIIHCLSYVRAFKYANAPLKFSGCEFDGGFPFSAYSACFGQPESLKIIWAGLIMNFVFAVLFGLSIDYIVRTVWLKSDSADHRNLLS